MGDLAIVLRDFMKQAFSSGLPAEADADFCQDVESALKRVLINNRKLMLANEALAERQQQQQPRNPTQQPSSPLAARGVAAGVSSGHQLSHRNRPTAPALKSHSPTLRHARESSNIAGAKVFRDGTPNNIRNSPGMMRNRGVIKESSSDAPFALGRTKADDDPAYHSIRAAPALVVDPDRVAGRKLNIEANGVGNVLAGAGYTRKNLSPVAQKADLQWDGGADRNRLVNWKAQEQSAGQRTRQQSSMDDVLRGSGFLKPQGDSFRPYQSVNHGAQLVHVPLVPGRSQLEQAAVAKRGQNRRNDPAGISSNVQHTARNNPSVGAQSFDSDLHKTSPKHNTVQRHWMAQPASLQMPDKRSLPEGAVGGSSLYGVRPAGEGTGGQGQEQHLFGQPSARRRPVSGRRAVGNAGRSIMGQGTSSAGNSPVKQRPPAPAPHAPPSNPSKEGASWGVFAGRALYDDAMVKKPQRSDYQQAPAAYPRQDTVEDIKRRLQELEAPSQGQRQQQQQARSAVSPGSGPKNKASKNESSSAADAIIGTFGQSTKYQSTAHSAQQDARTALDPYSGRHANETQSTLDYRGKGRQGGVSTLSNAFNSNMDFGKGHMYDLKRKSPTHVQPMTQTTDTRRAYGVNGQFASQEEMRFGNHAGKYARKSHLSRNRTFDPVATDPNRQSDVSQQEASRRAAAQGEDTSKARAASRRMQSSNTGIFEGYGYN